MVLANKEAAFGIRSAVHGTTTGQKFFPKTGVWTPRREASDDTEKDAGGRWEILERET